MTTRLVSFFLFFCFVGHFVGKRAKLLEGWRPDDWLENLGWSRIHPTPLPPPHSLQSGDILLILSQGVELLTCRAASEVMPHVSLNQQDSWDLQCAFCSLQIIARARFPSGGQSTRRDYNLPKKALLSVIILRAHRCSFEMFSLLWVLTSQTPWSTAFQWLPITV